MVPTRKLLKERVSYTYLCVACFLGLGLSIVQTFKAQAPAQHWAEDRPGECRGWGLLAHKLFLLRVLARDKRL